MDTADSQRSPLPVWFSLLVIFGSIIGFCWSKQDYVAASALAAIAIAGMWGYVVGSLRLFGFFGGLIASYYYAAPVGHYLSPHVAKYLETSPGVTRMASLGLGSVAVMFGATVGVWLISWLLLRNRPEWQAANRLAGFCVGGFQGAIGMLLLLSGLIAVEPLAKQRLSRSAADSSPLARGVSKRVVQIAKQTRASTVGPLVAEYNPFEKLPQLKNLHRTAVVASNPMTLQKMMHSASIEKLKNNPEIRKAMESLADDPELRKLVESGKGIDAKTAMSLLDHPSVAKLLDQPELMKHLTEAMADLDPELMKTAMGQLPADDDE